MKNRQEIDQYKAALEVVQHSGRASTAFIEQRLGVTYLRAAELINELETRKIISMLDGSRKYTVL